MFYIIGVGFQSPVELGDGDLVVIDFQLLLQVVQVLLARFLNTNSN